MIWIRSILLLLLSISSAACFVPLIPAPTAPPLPRDSGLQLFIEPEAGNAPILRALGAAKQSIKVTIYLLTQREMIDALKAARGRGVEVRVLIEDEPYGSGAGNKQAIADLQAANIAVKPGNPAYRLTHQKSIVIDDRLAFIMTLNLTHSAFTLNREYGIVTTNPEDVAEINAVFEADWNRRAPTLSNPNLVWSPTNARQRIFELIDSAQQSLDVEHLQMQDEQTIARLIAAHKRGVVVRVIGAPQDSPSDPDARGQETLRKGGVQVRLVKSPIIHAKLIIADNARALVSSQNISTASLDFNRELGILITDPNIIQALAATFASDWNLGK